MSDFSDDEIFIDPELFAFDWDDIDKPQHNPVSPPFPLRKDNIDLGTMQYNPRTGNIELSGPAALIAGVIGLAGLLSSNNDHAHERRMQHEAERRETVANQRAETAEKEKKEVEKEKETVEKEKEKVEKEKKEAEKEKEKAEKEKKEAHERAYQAELESKALKEKLKLEEELRQM